ncbi:hypothetical protein [Macrococcus equipercicus]|uniref:Uncharacterized protein n=1 Tax=Macrococcus equipercicus TaxID=69967 RepID=A0A9Q9BP11_9STAP|nr:hypothetical protein [Macrococcus equipercicus]KAA1040272.1 hypothetical protein ERX35_004585 [Macrococcus equipercicus]UTH12784.1 hypothetical protein KFV11_05705 [Macrococcus equipercicus]
MLMNIILYFLCFILYMYSGPFIKLILVKMSTTRMPASDHVGLLIGYLERLLIIIFILLKEYTAIGLIIASKSILRFNDMKQDPVTDIPEKVDKRSEYILLGTMLSLTIGMLIGLLASIDFSTLDK